MPDASKWKNAERKKDAITQTDSMEHVLTSPHGQRKPSKLEMDLQNQTCQHLQGGNIQS
jgi:hypothetical protein